MFDNSLKIYYIKRVGKIANSKLVRYTDYFFCNIGTTLANM